MFMFNLQFNLKMKGLCITKTSILRSKLMAINYIVMKKVVPN